MVYVNYCVDMSVCGGCNQYRRCQQQWEIFTFLLQSQVFDSEDGWIILEWGAFSIR